MTAFVRLDAACALTRLVGWNQVAADWAFFARHGAVQIRADAAETAVATAATLPYGTAVGWVAMILVRPDQRGQGLATALLRWAIEDLRARGTATIGLDATPAGQPVYRRLGFRDVWPLSRWRLPPELPPAPTLPTVRPLRQADWPGVLALDAAAFGADRAALLHELHQRRPAAAWVADGPAGLVGAILGRDGRTTPQLGPLWADNPAVAHALLTAAAPAALGAVVDLRDDATEVTRRLQDAGATRERGFVRMALGADLPGTASGLVAIAGPEFG